jgi:hypothetical protein
LGRVLLKPKSKIWIEGMGRGIPLDSEAGFEVFVGCGSSSGLLRSEVTSTVDLGGWLSAPTNSGLSAPTISKLSFPLVGVGSYLMDSNLSVFEGSANFGLVSSNSEFGSASPGVSLPAISSPCLAFSGSLVIASSSNVSAPFECSILDSKGFSEGFSLALEFFEVGSDFRVSSLGATALGDRLRFSLSIMSESGAPIYSSESKSVLRYHRRSKEKIAKMDTSLFDKAHIALSAPVTPFLGASSQALGGTVVQSSLKLGGGAGKSPPSSFLWRGFLLPSVPCPLSGYASPIAEKEVNFRSNGLIQFSSGQ